ncbi:MAG: DUF5689 domain-containing protein [Bacteroidales bacterium]|nr:DUF5689 domain-containing protein [Bacteroidales bacterium]
MKIKIYITGIILAAVTIISSCEREPVLPPEPTIDYITIEQLRAMYDSGFAKVDTNVYIQGIITLTPELGNVPDFIGYIQDTTAGLCLTVTGTNTLARDSKVTIFCRGLSFTMYNGLLQFGDIDIAKSSQFRIDSLTPAPLEPVSVTLNELLDGKHQAEYVSVSGVQFLSTGTFSGTKVLTDCNSEIDVYTRSAATFSGVSIPDGNGTLKGVASLFNTMQILLRDPSDLDMEGNLCGIPSKTYLEQSFTGLTSSMVVNSIPGWLAYGQAGTVMWKGYYYSSNYFARTTAFSSGQASVITWMIAPQIDLSTATNPFVSFESADGYDNGATLKLYISTNYTGTSTPWTATWTELPFTRPPVTTSGYSPFVSSGKVDLSAYNGSTIYIAWVYTGADPSGTVNDDTTTWEVDNVLVAEE